jgi:hypothetical protein
LLHKPPCIICLYVYCLSYVEDNWCSPHVALVKWRRIYTGWFIMFSVITNIYNKKTKGLTLMEMFTATGKLKKFFFDNWRCPKCAPRVTGHTSIRIQVLATHASTWVHRYCSVLQWSVILGQRGHVAILRGLHGLWYISSKYLVTTCPTVLLSWFFGILDYIMKRPILNKICYFAKLCLTLSLPN